MNKLNHYGIRGNSYDIIKSYLSNRKQVVRINDQSSDMKDIKQGVPQGSILGPLLFIIYINDMPEEIERSVLCLYADDTTIVTMAATVEELRENSEIALKTAQQWYSANGLTLNNDKTQKLTFNRTSGDNQPMKFLGVHMDADLKWKAHTHELSKSLNSAIFCIRRIKSIATPQAAKLVYYSSFHSKMTYGILFWGASSCAQRIFLLQKRALRALLGLTPTTSCRDHFREEGILTLASTYILACFQHVTLNLSTYAKNDYCHEYLTRHGQDLRTPWHRTSRTQENGIYWGTKIYNHLPKEIRCLPTKMLLKEMKEILLGMSVYSVEEYFKLLQ